MLPNAERVSLASGLTTAMALRVLRPSIDLTGPGIALAGWLIASAWRHAVDSRVRDDAHDREQGVRAVKAEVLDILVEAGLSQRDAHSTFEAIRGRLATIAAS